VVDGVWVNCWRLNNSGGNIIATLSSGPLSLTSGNGTLIESVSLPASAVYDAGGSFSPVMWQGANWDKPHWVFFPFSQNRTLSLGQIYNIRISASGGGDFRFRRTIRAELHGLSPGFSSHGGNFDTYIANRTVSWLMWEDSMGSQTSTNSGDTWTNPTSLSSPILFRCAT
jgi:hypothetical protein